MEEEEERDEVGDGETDSFIASSITQRLSTERFNRSSVKVFEERRRRS